MSGDAEPVESGEWRVFGAGLPHNTRIITPEGDVVERVVDVSWSQDARGIGELTITIQAPVAAISSAEPPTIVCDRCRHEHKCETEHDVMMRSLMSSAGGRATLLPSSRPIVGHGP